jgi:hypothetical protein
MGISQNTIITAGSNTSVSLSSQIYALFGGAIFNYGNTSTGSVRFRTPGKLSHLYLRISANSVGGTGLVVEIYNRALAAVGNQTISVGASATGEFEDTTHTDTVLAGDDWLTRFSPNAAGSATFGAVSYLYLDTGGNNTTTRLICGNEGTNANGASATYFFPVSGDSLATANAETFFKCRQRIAGTMKNLFIRTATPRVTTSTFKSRKNGADGAMVISLNGVSGAFEDTVNSDSVAAGDDYNYTLVNGTGTDNQALDSMAVDFVTTTGEGQCINSIDTGTAITDASTTYYNVTGGKLQSFSTESQWNTKARDAFTFEQLTCMISQNDDSNGGTLTFRKNSAPGTQSVAITGSTTGVFSDTTHSDVVAATDEVDVQLAVTSVGGSHTITPTSISVWTLSTSTPAVTKAQTVFIEWEES